MSLVQAHAERLEERRLEVPTRLLLEARARNPALAELDLERELERLEHVWIDFKGLRIHLECHDPDPGAATFIVVHGLGDHSRRHLGLATALAGRGYNSLLVDRQGHGLSEGRRGDAPLEADLELLEVVIALVRSRSDGPVVLLGDSLGGIMTWYLLTREPDIDAAICHCIAHPNVHPDPSFARKAPLVRAVGRVLPQLAIPVTQIADYDQVALDPETRRQFADQADPIFNFKVSARSVASYIGFSPQIAWERVATPALVAIGGADGMVTPEFTRRALERARPPRADYLEVAEAGHQLFLDDLGAAVDPILDWIEATLP